MTLQVAERRSEGPAEGQTDTDLDAPYKALEEAVAARLEDAGYESYVKYYDRKANVIGMARYCRLNEMGDPEYGPTWQHYKWVRKTRVGAFEVSTVWIGLDMGMSMIYGGPPIIFETMVFGAEPGELHEFDTDRYATEEQAIAGHEQMVTVVRATTLSDDVEEVWPE